MGVMIAVEFTASRLLKYQAYMFWLENIQSYLLDRGDRSSFLDGSFPTWQRLAAETSLQ